MLFSSENAAKEVIKNALKNNTWEQDLFSSEYLPVYKLYESEEQVRNSILFPAGGFYYESKVKQLCYNALRSSVDEIASWTVQSKRTVRLYFNYDYAVGYTVSSPEAEKKDAYRVVLALRKERDTKTTKHGFYVSAFNIDVKF